MLLYCFLVLTADGKLGRMAVTRHLFHRAGKVFFFFTKNRNKKMTLVNSRQAVQTSSTSNPWPLPQPITMFIALQQSLLLFFTQTCGVSSPI